MASRTLEESPGRSPKASLITAKQANCLHPQMLLMSWRWRKRKSATTTASLNQQWESHQLHSQLHSQLYSLLYSPLYTQLYSPLYTQLHSRRQLHPIWERWDPADLEASASQYQGPSLLASSRSSHRSRQVELTPLRAAMIGERRKLGELQEMQNQIKEEQAIDERAQ